jgi:hypothetical protein
MPIQVNKYLHFTIAGESVIRINYQLVIKSHIIQGPGVSTKKLLTNLTPGKIPPVGGVAANLQPEHRISMPERIKNSPQRAPFWNFGLGNCEISFPLKFSYW